MPRVSYQTVEIIEAAGYQLVLDKFLINNSELFVWLASDKRRCATGLSAVPAAGVMCYDGLEECNPEFQGFLLAHGFVADDIKASERTMPRNNDGRTTCCQCSAPTKNITLFFSVAQVCTRCGY
jgi:hypothetical protein